jgi:hypothetical protein
VVGESLMLLDALSLVVMGRCMLRVAAVSYDVCLPRRTFL